MRRLALVLVGVSALAAAPAQAATKSYSTGTIRLPVPAGATTERGLAVPHAGPVSFVRASFRIATPDTGELSISLVSPRGTVVPLVVRRGAGADFGEGNGCKGAVTVLDADMTTNPVAEGQAPFTDNPYRPEDSLKKLYGEQAKGRWVLRIVNGGNADAMLTCFQLDISRDVPSTITKRQGSIRAAVTFTERDFQFTKVGVSITRAGKKLIDTPLLKVRGCSGCDFFRPTGITIRDLDGGEPEVIFEFYSGGAHCCSVTVIYRYDAKSAGYRSKLADWGNYGYRLVDLDKDGLPEISAFDERFVYTFTAYVFSAAPAQIWQYRAGALVDVTREFPKVIERQAAELKGTYTKERGNKDEIDLRAFVAAYVADLYLLERGDEAKAFLQQALARGDLAGSPGWPAGKKFVSELNRFLKETGYIR